MRIHRQAWALLAITLAAVGAAQLRPVATHSRAASHRTAEGRFTSLSQAGALRLDAAEVRLGQLTAGERVYLADVLAVRNTSGRTLKVQVRVEGAPDLRARISPAVLRPGETAGVTITGRSRAAGPVTGRLAVTAFNGYIRRQVPLSGRVLPAPPAEPACAEPEPAAPVDAVDATAPDLLDANPETPADQPECAAPGVLPDEDPPDSAAEQSEPATADGVRSGQSRGRGGR